MFGRAGCNTALPKLKKIYLVPMSGGYIRRYIMEWTPKKAICTGLALIVFGVLWLYEQVTG